jgi:hypothetical protein
MLHALCDRADLNDIPFVADRQALDSTMRVIAALITAVSVLLAGPAWAGDMTAREVVARAHEAAGGAEWVDPRTLYMEGHGLFWRSGHEPVRYEPYRMWRVYPEGKDAAHVADGRVRIDAFLDGALVFQIAFDGQDTFNQHGRMDGAEASEEWANNFGFGAIRYALDEGYSLERLADDYVDGRPVRNVRVTDPKGGETLFSIASDDFQILKVAFATPRGWHERIYSDFYSNPAERWVQPGRVRLFYDGVKANETIWTAHSLNQEMDEALFRPGPAE